MIEISYMVLMIVTFAITCIVYKKLPTQSSIKIPLLPFLVFLIASMFIMNSHMIHQRFSDSEVSLQQFNEHDTWWHIALMKSLQQSVPPENPVYAGTVVSGYHYFTDLVWVGVHSVTKIPIETLYVWISPLLLSALLAISTLLVSEIVSKDWHVRLLTSILGLWGSGAAWYVTFLFQQARPVDSMFWLDQPVQYGINQQLMLSLAIGNFLLWLIFTQTKIPWWFTGILLGSLAGIKVYAFLVYFPIFGAMGLYQSFRKKNRTILYSTIFAAIISGITLFLNKSNYGFPFIYAPGWFIKTMFESGDHLNFPTWEIHRQLFVQTANYPRLFIHWFWAAILFFVGNFGIKILGTLSLVLIFFQYKNKKYSLQYTKVFVLFTLIFLSIFIPLFFIQKGVVWNSIQFMHYSQIPLTLLFVHCIQQVMKKKEHQLLFFVLAIMVSLPTTVMTILQNYHANYYVGYDKNTLDELHAISEFSNSTQIFVGPQLNNSSIVPALSGRSIQWADSTILSILGVMNEERLRMTKDLDSNTTPCSEVSVQIHQLDDGTVFVQDCRQVMKK